MKIIAYLILMLLFAQATLAQKGVSDYFDEGVQFSEDKKDTLALQSFLYIVRNHPKNELFPRALFNVGVLYYDLNNLDSAELVFRQILKSGFNEREQLGGGIMADPYTNYKHWASSSLSSIYYRREKYDTALYYLVMSDTAYPYLHFCGNEYAGYHIAAALRYADIYQKLNKDTLAIIRLLGASMITLEDNSEVLSELKKILIKDNYKNLKADLDITLDSKAFIIKTFSSGTYKYKLYYIPFLGTDVEIRHSAKEDKAADDDAIKEFKQSKLYKMISEM